MKYLFYIIILLCSLTSKAQNSIPNTISISDKVYGLSRFWQEVNYNFIYLDKIDKKAWDSTYKEMIPKVISSVNDYEYYRLLQKFCARLKDGHTNIFPPATYDKFLSNSMFGPYRLLLKNINNKAIVTQVNFSKKEEIPIGSEIIEVNNIPIQLYIKENVAPYISASTDYIVKDQSVRNLLLSPEGTSFVIKLKTPNGKFISLNLVNSRTTETRLYPSIEQKQLLDFKWYDNQIAYISLNSFNDPKIDSLFRNILPELYKAKGLIIDLRYNGGGNSNIAGDIMQYLVYENYLQHSRSYTREHLASFKAWGVYLTPKDTINNSWNTKCYIYNHDKGIYSFDYTPDTIDLKEKRIVLPTALLLGHSTASAAEDFLIMADNQKHMIKIGEKSYGSTGQPYLFNLSGGIYARVCTKKDTYPDGREFVGVGIKPDIEVIPTLNDYINQKDPVLTKALEIINKKISK